MEITQASDGTESGEEVDDNATVQKEQKGTYDEDEVAESLAKVGKGAVILFIGTLLGMIFGLLKRVLIARFYTPADYGLFNLYFTILIIFASIGAIGLKNGLQRNIAFYMGKDKKEKVPAIIGWGLLISIAGGILFGATLYLFADQIAALFSDDPTLGYYFELAALAVPFYVVTLAFISIFRGFQRTKERVLFSNMGRNALIFIFIVFIGFLGLSFDTIILSVSIAVIIVAIFFFLYYLNVRKSALGLERAFRFDLTVGKKLLLFSLPLLLVDIMYKVMGWADTMMIGYFMMEDSVGYYEAAKPISKLITSGLSVALFIYSPLAASLYARDKIKENRVIFTALTKWLCFGTLPIAMVFIFYPRWVLRFLFGGEYLPAVIPLQILAVVYFTLTMMGPNGATLTSYGKTKFLMYATGGAAALNVILNGVLIPSYGIIGAAAATGISLISVNLIRVKKLKDISGVHPLRPEVLKPTALSILVSVLLALGLRYLLPVSIIVVAISGLSFYAIFLSSMVLTKSLSKNDIRLLLLVEKKLGLDLSRIKSFLRRFV